MSGHNSTGILNITLSFEHGFKKVPHRAYYSNRDEKKQAISQREVRQEKIPEKYSDENAGGNPAQRTLHCFSRAYGRAKFGAPKI